MGVQLELLVGTAAECFQSDTDLVWSDVKASDHVLDEIDHLVEVWFCDTSGGIQNKNDVGDASGIAVWR